MADDQRELDRLRGRIDELDDQIQSLINERVEVAKSIARVKSNDNGESFYRPERESQILRAIVSRNRGPLTDEQITRVFREIMSATLAAEAPITVAFLGPQGTYTHSAALKHFGHSVTTAATTTIDEVFRAVERGDAHVGVVPVENSSEGVVTHTLDSFLDSPLKICGEIALRIRHNLLALATSVDSITTVMAHSQSLAQCRKWLSEHLPGRELQSVNSNAEAAERAAADARVAAIASRDAGELYRLGVLASNIEDDPGNTTRFLVIGNRVPGASGDDKTSLLVSSANKPGALYRLLEPLARNQVSMTRIESRPSRKGLWQYVFFIDIEGHCEEPKIREVLAELEKEATLVKLLGSYPRAVL